MVLTVDYTAVRVSSPFKPEIYQLAGHKEGTFVDFWIFNNGNLEVRDDWPSSFNHEFFWKNLPVESLYRGRYDPSKNWLSLTPPYKLRHRDVPSSLLAALEKRFPGAELKLFDVNLK
jgi:hypothetical protein